MQRRDFLAWSGIGAAAGANVLAAEKVHGEEGGRSGSNAAKFKLKYAPHAGMFKHSAGDDPVEQLAFAADQGFTAWEENGFKSWERDIQDRFAKMLQKREMTMGVFVAHGGFDSTAFASGSKDEHDRVLANIRESVEVAKRIGAKWMTVVPNSYDPKLEWGYQTANCIDLLRRCAAIFEPHGLVMVLEPLNWWTNHPGLLLHKIPQAYEICRAVNSPACKILFDIYHVQIQEGNLIPNIDRAWSEIGYFQAGDNPGRNEPGTGEINYRNVFKHIHGKGFDGVVGMEHGVSQKGREGEKALIEAYRRADDF